MPFARSTRVSCATVLSLCITATAAYAQLATSPDTALPEVTVTADEPASKPIKSKKAPAAAQQSSTPRQLQGGTPGTARETDTSDVAVSPTGVTSSVDQIASSVTVITSKEIEAKQQRTLPDVLKSVPGLNVVQIGGPGGTTSIFMRGTNPNHTKVFIDGIDVSDPSASSRTFDYGQMLTSDIERVEVLRGPQSGLYGADAVGGAIVIYTKKGEGPPKVSAMAEGGSFGTFNQAVGARGSSGRFNYAFNVAHYRADDVPVTPYNLLPPGFSRFDNSYDNWSFSTKLGADLSRDFTVNFVARYTDARLFYTADDPNAFPTYPNNFQSRQDTQQFYTRGEAVWRAFGGDVVSYFGINYADLHSDNRDINLTTFGDGERVEYDWRSVVKAAPGYTVVVGAKHQNEQLTVPDLFAEEWSRGAFVEAQTEPLRNLFVVANARIDDNENFGSHATWRLAPAYVIESTGTKIKGSVGTAFKAPTLSQRFQDFPDFLFFANPDLQPEESIGYDVGFEQAVLGGHVQFGATYFHNDLTQLIQSAFDPLTFRSTLVNIGSAKTEGVEVFASADITDDIRVRADYTYTEATNEDTGAWLQRRSRHKASFNVGWTPTDKLLLTGSVLFYGESLDLDRSTFGPTILPSFTVVNVGADYKLNDNMSLYGRIDNLFDERYEIPDGFEATGIGGYVGIRFTN